MGDIARAVATNERPLVTPEPERVEALEAALAAERAANEVLRAELLAARLDRDAARRINQTQRRVIEDLQTENARMRNNRGGWGDRGDRR